MRRTTKSKNGHIVTLGKHDVVCGKGRGKHEKTSGNLFYRSLINEKKDGYNDSNTIERVTLIGEIRELIEGKGGVFVSLLQIALEMTRSISQWPWTKSERRLAMIFAVKSGDAAQEFLPLAVPRRSHLPERGLKT